MPFSEIIALGLCVICIVAAIYGLDWVQRGWTEIEEFTDSDSRPASLRNQIIEGE